MKTAVNTYYGNYVTKNEGNLLLEKENILFYFNLIKIVYFKIESL